MLLPETEVQQYENVKLNLIENLADYIRDEYSLNKTPEQTLFDKLLEVWNQGRPQRILIKLKRNGFITKNGDVYNWKIDLANAYNKKLYAYFVFVASDKFGWRERKDKTGIPWRFFNPIFNMGKNKKEQDVLNDCMHEIKKPEYPLFPQRAKDIDDLFDW